MMKILYLTFNQQAYCIAHKLSHEIVNHDRLPTRSYLRQHFCEGSLPPPDLMIGIEVHALAKAL